MTEEQGTGIVETQNDLRDMAPLVRSYGLNGPARAMEDAADLIQSLTEERDRLTRLAEKWEREGSERFTNDEPYSWQDQLRECAAELRQALSEPTKVTNKHQEGEGKSE